MVSLFYCFEDRPISLGLPHELCTRGTQGSSIPFAAASGDGEIANSSAMRFVQLQAFGKALVCL